MPYSSPTFLYHWNKNLESSIPFFGNNAIQDWLRVVFNPNNAQFPRVPAASNPVIAIIKVPFGTILRLADFFPASVIFSKLLFTVPRFNSPLDNQLISPFQNSALFLEGVCPLYISASTSPNLRCSQSSVKPLNLISGTFDPFWGNIFCSMYFFSFFVSSHFRWWRVMRWSRSSKYAAIFFCSSKPGTLTFIFCKSRNESTFCPVPVHVYAISWTTSSLLFSTNERKNTSLLFPLKTG